MYLHKITITSLLCQDYALLLSWVYKYVYYFLFTCYKNPCLWEHHTVVVFFCVVLVSIDLPVPQLLFSNISFGHRCILRTILPKFVFYLCDMTVLYTDMWYHTPPCLTPNCVYVISLKYISTTSFNQSIRLRNPKDSMFTFSKLLIKCVYFTSNVLTWRRNLLNL